MRLTDLPFRVTGINPLCQVDDIATTLPLDIHFQVVPLHTPYSTMSLQTNIEASFPPIPSVVSDTSNISIKPVSSTDSSSVSSQQSDAPTTRVKTVLADFSPEEVTSPLEALALACEAERATEENQPATNKGFTDNDVLCGRGGLTNGNPGNIFFRRLVRMKQEAYLLASKREKAGVAREIVEEVQRRNGRFLKKDSNGVWVEICERKAREKTSQALREGAPELRAELSHNSKPHVIQPSLYPPRKFLKTDTCTSWMPSNRARVVSDDSVGLQGSLKQEATAVSSGSKRKVADACVMQEQRHASDSSSGSAVMRGPRLKLLKARLMV